MTPFEKFLEERREALVGEFNYSVTDPNPEYPGEPVPKSYLNSLGTIQSFHEETARAAFLMAIEQVREEVDFERVSFWGSPELEAATKSNNTVVDNVLSRLDTLAASVGSSEK